MRRYTCQWSEPEPTSHMRCEIRNIKEERVGVNFSYILRTCTTCKVKKQKRVALSLLL